MKLGTRSRFAGRTYEVTSILPNGGLRLRPVKDGCKSDGTQYDLGEACQIAVGKGRLPGVIVSVNPLRARVTVGARIGLEVGQSKVRKK